MWPLLDKLGRPSLAVHFQVRTLELNEQGLRLLAGRFQENLDWRVELVTNLHASAACWQTLRPLMSGAQRKRIKCSQRHVERLLRGVLHAEAPEQKGPWRRRWPATVEPAAAVRDLARHAGKPAERRAVDRLAACLARPALLSPGSCDALEAELVAQSRWLGELAPYAPDAAMLQALTRIYGKARKCLRRNPRTRRARRWLMALVWTKELMRPRIGPMPEGGIAGSAAARLLRGLEEDRVLQGLAAAGGLRGGKDSARMIRVIGRRRNEIANVGAALIEVAVGKPVHVMRAQLPWLVFQQFARAPVPLPVESQSVDG